MDLEHFKSQLDIVEVIGSFIPLKRAGVNYTACCPFHSEKSPSFMVSPQKQIYKCFGCDASGDVLTFIKEYKKIDFKEALNELCETYNLQNPLSKKESKTKSSQEGLKKLSDVFVANLLEKSTEEKHVPTKLRHYLQKRGFNDEDITNFCFGYCKGEEWKQFFSHDEAVKIGIVSQKGYCLFANRLTITLFNASYKPIGFVGRTHPYFNFRNSPKYINSRDSILYQKSKNLYNFARAKSDILNTKKVLIVEGYMDALAAWKMGIKNCVATGGTAFNKTFLAQLMPLEPEITFLFDNDEAGQKNTLNALRACIENGYSNVYKGILKQNVKDLGEVLEKGLQPQITKKDGVVYYLRESLAKQSTVRAKDEWLAQWKNFIKSQNNHFFKIDLIQKTKNALGIDISKEKVQSAPSQSNTNLQNLMSSIVNNKDCAYIASEYLNGDELGEWEADYKAFLSGKELSQNAQKLQWEQNKTDIASFRKLLSFVIKQHYEQLIQKATMRKDYTHARALSFKLLELKNTLFTLSC